MDDILDIDEVLTDSFYMPSEESYNDIQNIVRQWKDNEKHPSTVQNETNKYLDTRTFTRQKKRLSTNTNGFNDFDYQKSNAFPIDSTTTSRRNFILDSSPSNSLCSYVSDDTTSLITSGDFSNVSYLINNVNDMTFHFNELGLKKSYEVNNSNLDCSRISNENKTVTPNKIHTNSTNDDETIVPSNNEINTSHTLLTNAKLDDTFDLLNAKITFSNSMVPDNQEKDCLNLVQSTPKVYSRRSPSSLSSSSYTLADLSPITPKRIEFDGNNDKGNTFISDIPIEIDDCNNDEQQNSLVNFEEFEKSIFLDDDKCNEDFESLLNNMGNTKRIEHRDVLRESLDNIKKRHSLINLEIKHEHQKEKMNHNDNKTMISNIQKSIPDERLLRRSRLFDNVTINTTTINNTNSMKTHLDSNRTFNNESLHKINTNQLNNTFNSVGTVENLNRTIDIPIENEKISIVKSDYEISDEPTEKYDNRDRFKTIRLSKKPTTNTVFITDNQSHVPIVAETIKPKPIVARKHIEPISNPKTRQISTLFTRDSYLKSSSVENLNSRNGFQKLKIDSNGSRSSSTQSLDKTTTVTSKTSMLKDRSIAASKLKPHSVSNVAQKSIPVFNSRTNVNKLSGLMRPSSGFYSYNTDVDKFELTKNIQSSGDNALYNDDVKTVQHEPKVLPSKLAKPSGLRQPTKISCLPRPTTRR